MSCDVTKWSGDGDLAQRLFEWLRGIEAIADIRVEDASTSRSAADHAFVSTDVFVGFVRHVRVASAWRFGFVPARRTDVAPAMSLGGLATLLAAVGHRR